MRRVLATVLSLTPNPAGDRAVAHPELPQVPHVVRDPQVDPHMRAIDDDGLDGTALRIAGGRFFYEASASSVVSRRGAGRRASRARPGWGRASFEASEPPPRCAARAPAEYRPAGA